MFAARTHIRPLASFALSVILAACSPSALLQDLQQHEKTNGATLSSAKAVTAFNFTTPAATGVVIEASHTIAITVPYGTSVTALTPSITTTGATVSPPSGTSQNFTSPVAYTVTAADSSTQAYTVTVNVVPSNSLMAEYLFNGNANDTSAAGNNATANSCTFVSDRHGNANQACSFNGVNAYVSLVKDLPATSSPFTWTAWINDPNGGDGAIIMQGGAPGAYGNCRSLSVTGGYLQFYLYNTTGNISVTCSTAVTANTWYFVTCVYDGSTASLYVNGTLSAQSPYTYGYYPATYFYIGNDPPYSDYGYKGLVDNVRVYDRVLTPAEIVTLSQE
jgi:hypothetical protein